MIFKTKRGKEQACPVPLLRGQVYAYYFVTSLAVKKQPVCHYELVSGCRKAAAVELSSQQINAHFYREIPDRGPG